MGVERGMFGRYEDAYKILAGNLDGRKCVENLDVDKATI
jgi:hypothetical protein